MTLTDVKALYEAVQETDIAIKSAKAELKEKERLRKNQVVNYRKASVDRILDFIRKEYNQGRLCDLDTLLYHCQNKLAGNIDGVELALENGKPFKILKVGDSE